MINKDKWDAFTVDLRALHHSLASANIVLISRRPMKLSLSSALFATAIACCGNPGNAQLEQTLFVTDGTLASTAVNQSNWTIQVDPSTLISGTIELSAQTNWHNSAVISAGYTWSWGDRTSSFETIGLGTITNSGDGKTTIPLNIEGPSTPGVHYIVFGLAAEYEIAALFSGTNWTAGSPVWNDGNDIWDLSPESLIEAKSNGFLQLPYLSNNGIIEERQALTPIKIIVGADAPRIHLSSGSLSGQSLEPNNWEIVVEVGQSIEGQLTFDAVTAWHSGAVLAAGYTWTWGDRDSSITPISTTGVAKSGSSVLPSTVDLVAPESPGTYYIVFGLAAEYDISALFSGTNWTYSGPIWNDGNDAFDMTDSQWEQASASGYLNWSCLTSESTVDLQRAVAPIRVVVTEKYKSFKLSDWSYNRHFPFIHDVKHGWLYAWPTSSGLWLYRYRDGIWAVQ